jgi:hypothetical protein
MTRERAVTDVSLHVVNAVRAAWTAASTSSTEARRTPFCGVPRAGSYTSPTRSEVPATLCPPIQWS